MGRGFMESPLDFDAVPWDPEPVRLVAADVSRLKLLRRRVSGLTSAATKFMESRLGFGVMLFGLLHVLLQRSKITFVQIADETRGS